MLVVLIRLIYNPQSHTYYYLNKPSNPHIRDDYLKVLLYNYGAGSLLDVDVNFP